MGPGDLRHELGLPFLLRDAAVDREGTGKRMSVNPVATPAGNVAARQVGGRYVAGYVITAVNPLRPGFTAFLAHWAECDMKPRTRTPTPKPPTNFLF